MAKLSHHESHILALIQKWQPTTAYFVRKALGQALASDASDSPGSVYPAIERLKRGGFALGEPDELDGRKTERLRCSETGAAAVREWVTRVDKADLLPADPWRTRIGFVDALKPAEAREWLFAIRAALEQEQASIERLRGTATGDGRELEIAHARLTAAARLAWVNEAIATLGRAKLQQTQKSV